MPICLLGTTEDMKMSDTILATKKYAGWDRTENSAVYPIITKAQAHKVIGSK